MLLTILFRCLRKMYSKTSPFHHVADDQRIRELFKRTKEGFKAAKSSAFSSKSSMNKSAATENRGDSIGASVT